MKEFIKIKEAEILEVDQIKRVIKKISHEYEKTEGFTKWLEENMSSLFCFYNGDRYTDKIIHTEYTLVIYTVDFEELEFGYETEEELESEFTYIWNSIPVAGGEINE